METIKKIMANISFAIIVLLTFLLIFEHQLELPAWLQAFGRMHPLLLHIPIGLLLLTALLVFLRKYFESASFDSLISFLLHIAVLTASVTALMGLFLSREGGYNEQDLQLHKWFGVVTCYSGAGLLLVLRKERLFKISLIACVCVLIVTGHYGAMLTHGENFVLGPLQKEKSTTEIPEDATVFEAVVLPLFDRKCTSCHNETKAKGKLILTSIDHVLKGGKSGSLWDKNDPGDGLLMKRLLLPLEDKKHMPLNDKPQLSEDELRFILLWLNKGADTKRKLSDYMESDSLRVWAVKLIANIQPHDELMAQYHFDFVDPQKIASLNNPYRSVFQLAQHEPALQADFFVRQAFDKKSLEELRSVKDQLVALSLAKMPVTDEEMKLISPFQNLEILNLNNTDITGKNLSELNVLEKLQSLSLAGTKISIESMDALQSLKNLKKVYIWNTNIRAGEVDELKKKYPGISWEAGYIPDPTEVLQLSAPLLLTEKILRAGEKIALKTSLPGSTIRYTVNGVDPDSVSGEIYTEPILSTPYQVIKAVTVKDGWKKSPVADFIIYQAGYKPSRAELKTVPESRYPGEGVSTFSDGKKGSPDFFRDPVWMGFREGYLEAFFWFDTKPEIHSVIVSYAENTYAMTLPPAEIEIWGGEDEEHLTLVQREKPVQPTGYRPTRVRGAEIIFPSSRYKCYKLIAWPMTKQPAFLTTKEKGWLMVDEIFFN